ncbi:MAG: TraB/GumN family protein, partial [Owenweeksia sp.]
MKKRLIVLFAFLVHSHIFGQYQKEYQGLLWKITGNGLEKPSYLYGTMHVSDRVAFHLSETFFTALDQADVVALETNPEHWIENIAISPLYQDYFAIRMEASQEAFPLYTSFIPHQPKQNELEYYLSQDQDMLNNMLWRFSPNGQNFEEGTFLDLFIYQTGKKKGKKVVALEDFEGSFRSVLMSNRYDKDAKPISERQALNLLGNFQSWEELQEDAYRRGDLDLMDTIVSSLYTSRYYRENMLDTRNQVMVNGMDSLMRGGTLFTGVGAAHLPGANGVINLLRQRGYTVTAEERMITRQSIDQKELIDAIIFEHPMQEFVSDDGFVTTQVPGTMTKLVAGNYHEYLYADMANGAYYSLRRIYTNAPYYGKSADTYAAKIDSLLFENIPGKIVSNVPIRISGYPGIDIVNTTREGNWQRYHIIYTPLEMLIFKAGGAKEFVKSGQPQEFFRKIKLGGSRNKLTTFEPAYGGFEVSIPQQHRHENYPGIFYNPFQTYTAEALDESGN